MPWLTSLPTCRRLRKATSLPVRQTAACVAFPRRFSSLPIAPTRDSLDNASVVNSADSTVDSFPGFDEKHVSTLDGLARLLRRNEVLNVCEGLMAACVLANSGGHANAFETSERVLYIVSCLANAFCLRCAPDMPRTHGRPCLDARNELHSRNGACSVQSICAKDLRPMQPASLFNLNDAKTGFVFSVHHKHNPGANMHVVCSVATRNFEAVEAKEPQGLVDVMAGVQDLNILFSNVAFVAILRGTVQVMEAGIEDPDLVVWLQARSCEPVAAIPQRMSKSQIRLRSWLSHERLSQQWLSYR